MRAPPPHPRRRQRTPHRLCRRRVAEPRGCWAGGRAGRDCAGSAEAGIGRLVHGGALGTAAAAGCRPRRGRSPCGMHVSTVCHAMALAVHQRCSKANSRHH
eukprot:363668-Chlamydomonas_euryale.AAC.2